MTGGSWRMLAVLALLALLSLLTISPVDAQASQCASCDSRATCYYSSDRGWYCACDGYYTGNGFTCKYSTWRVVVYMIVSIIGFLLILCLCLSCLGYRRQQEQQVGYPMQPMRAPPYVYPPAGVTTQSTGHPAVYGYPPQGAYPPQGVYPPPNGYPPQVMNQPAGKVPGPSGTV